jgi:XTP/dITP diphosphohydrolase
VGLTLVVATRNAGKLVELRELLGGLDLTLIDLTAAGVAEDLIETGDTFAANAIQKAERARDLTGCPVLADDSGLCVEALNGAPGVLSARYGGPGLDDGGRVRRLLVALDEVPTAPRDARFVCVLALARPGQPTLTVTGEVTGTIASAPRGCHGFGYDPIFFLPERGVTMAELDPTIKNRISHRGRAVAALRPVLAHLATDATP